MGSTVNLNRSSGLTGRSSRKTRATTAQAIQEAATVIQRLAAAITREDDIVLAALPPIQLSAQDLELLRLIVEHGLQYKEIAYRMNLSYGTVKLYAQRLFRRYGCHTALEMCVRYWRGRLEKSI